MFLLQRSVHLAHRPITIIPRDDYPHQVPCINLKEVFGLARSCIWHRTTLSCWASTSRARRVATWTAATMKTRVFRYVCISTGRRKTARVWYVITSLWGSIWGCYLTTNVRPYLPPHLFVTRWFSSCVNARHMLLSAIPIYWLLLFVDVELSVCVCPMWRGCSICQLRGEYFKFGTCSVLDNV